MHLLVEACPGQLCEPSIIMRVGPVRFHRLQALVRLPGIDAHNRNTQFAQAQTDHRRS